MFLFISYCLNEPNEKTTPGEIFYQLYPLFPAYKKMTEGLTMKKWYQPGPSIKDPEGLLWVKNEIVGACDE